MKRLIIPTIISAGIIAICSGQYQPRVAPAKSIRLSKPSLTGPLSFEQALANRRSIRQFTSQPLTLEQIGQLAWAGQGITEPKEGFRTAPSAGAIYPISLYFATKDGLFLYHPEEHSLEKTLDADIRDSLGTAALKQEPVAKAACDIIIAGSLKKLVPKYGFKARRYTLLEAGHVAQNIHLQAVCMELASVPIGAFDIRNASKICRLPIAMEPLYIICVGYPGVKTAAEGEEKKQEKETAKTETVKAMKALLIVASENFRDEELFETQTALEDAEVETVIASTKTGTIKGMLGNKAQATVLVNDIIVDDYDVIIFTGGEGAKEYLDNKIALNIAREAKNKGKILAAICTAPSILANAGVLSGVRVTAFPSERNTLKKADAIYTAADIEQDGLIITARGPKVADKFGKAIAEAITKQ